MSSWNAINGRSNDSSDLTPAHILDDEDLQDDEDGMRSDTPGEPWDSHMGPDSISLPAGMDPNDMPELVRSGRNPATGAQYFSMPSPGDSFDAVVDSMHRSNASTSEEHAQYRYTRDELLFYQNEAVLERQRSRQGSSATRRNSTFQYRAPTRIPSYLAELACDPSPSQPLAPARPSPIQLARPHPDRMLRYDNVALILPDAYLDEPQVGRFALQVLNPYQLEYVQGIIPVDLLFAIEQGRLDYALECALEQTSGVEHAVWCCQAYAQHERALMMLSRGGLWNPYEEREYQDLMSGWEGTRRSAWTGVERRREQWVAMLREYEDQDEMPPVARFERSLLRNGTAVRRGRSFGASGTDDFEQLWE